MPMHPKPCIDTTSPSGPSVRVGNKLSGTGVSLLEVDRRDDVADGCASRPCAPACGVVAQALQHDVCRRRDVVLPAEQRDLTVEVVRLDAAEASSQALPRRSATARASLDRCVLHLLAAPRDPFVVARPVDAGGRQARLRLDPENAVEVTDDFHVVAVEIMATKRLDGVAEVAQQLGVLPP